MDFVALNKASLIGLGLCKSLLHIVSLTLLFMNRHMGFTTIEQKYGLARAEHLGEKVV